MNKQLFTLLFLLFMSCKQITGKVNVQNESELDLDNSSLIIKDGDQQYYLTRCDAFKRNDSLFLDFTDTNKLSNYYELHVIKINDNYFSICNNTFSITDSSYIPPVMTTYFQDISLDKRDYEIGDSIVGRVNLKISSYNRWPEMFTDTLIIQGSFKAKVH